MSQAGDHTQEHTRIRSTLYGTLRERLASGTQFMVEGDHRTTRVTICTQDGRRFRFVFANSALLYSVLTPEHYVSHIIKAMNRQL